MKDCLCNFHDCDVRDWIHRYWAKVRVSPAVLGHALKNEAIDCWSTTLHNFHRVTTASTEKLFWHNSLFYSPFKSRFKGSCGPNDLKIRWETILYHFLAIHRINWLEIRFAIQGSLECYDISNFFLTNNIIIDLKALRVAKVYSSLSFHCELHIFIRSVWTHVTFNIFAIAEVNYWRVGLYTVLSYRSFHWSNLFLVCIVYLMLLVDHLLLICLRIGRLYSIANTFTISMLLLIYILVSLFICEYALIFLDQAL